MTKTFFWNKNIEGLSQCPAEASKASEEPKEITKTMKSKYLGKREKRRIRNNHENCTEKMSSEDGVIRNEHDVLKMIENIHMLK